MPSFGCYETVRELHRIGFIVVYSGRAADSPEEKFAIKAFQASALLLEKEQAKSEPDLFLSSASVQQRVSAGGAQYWAPIYERGSLPDGAFYVTNKYDYSLQQLIDGRVKLTAQNLHTIIESAVKGLIELKQVCSRPHGNLKTTNVLIAAAADFSQTRVALSDPLPDEYIDTEVHWDTDLRAIAEFIYELVMYRPSPVASGWQVPETKEWSRLGRQANDWRNLCNRLLNTHIKPGEMTIETLLEELAKLKVTKPVPSHYYIIAAGLIVALCAVIWWSFFHKPPMPPQLEDWNMLYSEYIGWVDDLHKDNTLKKQWGDDQDLKKILVKIRDASYPDSVALENSKTVNDLKDIKTEEELQLLGVTEKAVSDALKAVNDIKSFFDPNSDKAWPLLRRINKDAKDFNERGWQRPAAYLQNLVDSVRPTPDNNTLAANVDKLIKLRRRGITEKIRVCLDDIAKYQKKITGFNDGFVNKEAALGLGDAGEESLSKLSKNLQEINKLAGELAGYIDEMDGLVRKIESYIKEGRISNPAEAAACEVNLSELMPVIKEIRSIKGIAKNEQDIRQGIDQLDKLRERAFRAIEKPEEYVKRIKQTLSAAKSEKIAEKWEIVKKNLLPKIEQNPKDMSLYSEFRQKIDKANDDLIALDEELQEKLPQELIAELGEKIWQQRLRQIYEQERKDTINRIVEKIPMTNAVPDINEATFKNQRDEQYSEFGKWRDNLAGIVGDFNAIADGLELCYLLDDILPQRQESISSIWKNWKDRDVPKKREIEDGLNELISRVEMLVEVKLSGDRQKLVATALDPKSQPEAVYAAWEKLGVLSNPKWPNQAEDWENDKKIQETLKLQFNTIKGQNQSRGDELLNMLDTARDKREKVYREVSIERYRADIKKYSYQDQTLLQFEKFQPYGPDPNLSEINDFEALASKLAEFVTSEDWQSKKFDTNLFYMFCKPETITFEDWPKKIKEYRIIEPDPREQYAWKKTMEDIKNELPTAEDSNKLRADFEKVKPDIYKMLDLSAIEKNRGEFEKSEGYWKQLLAIQEQLKPSYCNYLNLANGKVTFASEVNLQAFEPVLKNDNDSFSPPPVTKWNDIKNIKDKFFYPTSDSDANWPRYIRSSKDQSVILAFIPAGRDNPEPFYMATKEITNAQYCLFLKNIDAKDSGKLGGGVEFVGQDHKPLISWASDEEPHGAIKYDKLKKGSYVDEPNNNAPVTWVTFSGADSYAVWLSGKLPLASQHRYACRANADTKNPWWNDRAQIPLYAHVRAAAWQRIAKEYNSTIGSLEVGLCPIGAVKEKTPLDINNIVEDGYNSPWPIATKTKANEWGLCDMIGNVWEWCRSDEKSTQTVICGGSCLAPKDYVAPDSKYDFKGGRACDVGFRVIVPAKQSP